MDEIELKFLDINVAEITRKIEKLGAKFKYDSTLEAYYFLAEGFSGSRQDMKFLRIRRIGDKSFLTYKDPAKLSEMSVREETEIEVSDFGDTVSLIEKLGFTKGYLTKKHRIHYEFGDVHFELDTQLGVEIPTYLEIETRTEEAMIDICQKLDLDISKGKNGSIEVLYAEEFAEINILNHPLSCRA